MTILTRQPLDPTLRSIHCIWEFGRVNDVLSLKHDTTLVGSVYIKDDYYTYSVEEGPNLGNIGSGSDLMSIVKSVESMALHANPKVVTLIQEYERIEAESVHAVLVKDVVNFMTN